MNRPTNNFLIWSGIIALAGGVIHVLTIFGGASWYRFIGATEAIVRMAARGSLYPIFVCLLAAAVMFSCAAFAFSGAGIIWRLPFLRSALVLISGGLIFHGIAFIPLVMLWPRRMIAVYDGEGINVILIVTSLICLASGITYGLGARQAWKHIQHGGNTKGAEVLATHLATPS